MNGSDAANMIRLERKMLMNIVNDFKQEDEYFKPTPEMLTVAQQIHHIAQSTQWFFNGAFSGMGFDMDYDAIEVALHKMYTLSDALTDLNIVYVNWISHVEKLKEEDLVSPMVANPIFGHAPKASVIAYNADHTAHHRGALTVYLRLLGRTPKSIYE